jgi:hypothetical protein
MDLRFFFAVWGSAAETWRGKLPVTEDFVFGSGGGVEERRRAEKADAEFEEAMPQSSRWASAPRLS